jgi:hypothetical protein
MTSGCTSLRSLAADQLGCRHPTLTSACGNEVPWHCSYSSIACAQFSHRAECTAYRQILAVRLMTDCDLADNNFPHTSHDAHRT